MMWVEAGVGVEVPSGVTAVRRRLGVEQGMCESDVAVEALLNVWQNLDNVLDGSARAARSAKVMSAVYGRSLPLYECGLCEAVVQAQVRSHENNVEDPEVHELDRKEVVVVYVSPCGRR
eukprot:5044085-Amphidinium_carterae.1